MIDYSNELNPSQYEAVTYIDSPCLVVAGAGSGKTRVLTYKIAYLVENGFLPWNILALTFTNKAADEMKSRVAEQLGRDQASPLWMGTFHSIFSRILRMESSSMGYSSDYTIYDSADSKSLIKSVIKTLGLDQSDTYKEQNVMRRISEAKNNLMLPDEYAHSVYAEEDVKSRCPRIADIYKAYNDRCKASDAMDFDDLLLNTYLLFRDHPDVLSKYRAKFQYVLVDEYQDTNYAQHMIVHQLCQGRTSLTVVGDDAQSIYSFRGAVIGNILGFDKQYPDARTFKLERNYRSTQTIVNAANSLIDKNRNQIRKRVYSELSKGERIPVSKYYDDKSEALGVARRILSLHREYAQKWNSFAILYRTNAQSRPFEDVLAHSGIPYRIYGGLSFYQRKEVKDAVSYFRMACNPNDDEAFRRIINTPARGIGETTVARILSCAYDSGVSAWEVISDMDRYGLDVNRGTRSKLEGFQNMVFEFVEKSGEMSADSLAALILDKSGLGRSIYSDPTDEGKARQENIDSLRDALRNFVMEADEIGSEEKGMRHFLHEVSLLSDLDGMDQRTDDHVVLMTVHSAKGLEFDNVFVVGMEQNLFPSDRSRFKPDQLEEERRLFYVAVTRAKLRCLLSYSLSRFMHGSVSYQSPSQFLKEIAPEFLDEPDEQMVVSKPAAASGFRARPYGSYGDRDYNGGWRNGRMEDEPKLYAPKPPEGFKRVKKGNSAPERPASSSSATAEAFGLKAGSVIEHDRFGRGTVMFLSGEGAEMKARVRFDTAGEKQLLLKYARFKVIG